MDINGDLRSNTKRMVRVAIAESEQSEQEQQYKYITFPPVSAVAKNLVPNLFTTKNKASTSTSFFTVHPLDVLKVVTNSSRVVLDSNSSKAADPQVTMVKIMNEYEYRKSTEKSKKQQFDCK